MNNTNDSYKLGLFVLFVIIAVIIALLLISSYLKAKALKIKEEELDSFVKL